MNYEEAKKFFQEMGCSTFHMAREYPEKYQEFSKLNVTILEQEEWRKESFDNLNQSIYSGNFKTSFSDYTKPELRYLIAEMITLALDGDTKNYLHILCETILYISDRLPDEGKYQVAYSIGGYLDINYFDSLIFKAYFEGGMSDAIKFRDIALKLLTDLSEADPEKTKLIKRIHNISIALKLVNTPNKLLQLIKKSFTFFSR